MVNEFPKTIPVTPVSSPGAGTFTKGVGLIEGRRIPDADLPTEFIEGVLDVSEEGSGLLRPEYIPSSKDVYISSSQIRRFNLRPGDWVGGQARSPKENERYWGLLKVEKVNGQAIEKITDRPEFDKLTSIYPDKQIILSTDKDILSTRVIDLVAPIGFGQRALIVSPPKAGKTWLMKDIATGITKNYPDVHIMAVLIGERPEEVTDMKHTIKGEVVASNFDEAPEDQVHIADVALEHAKRLTEKGDQVVILLDSITRLARAYNLALPTSGRTLTGGFDPAALYPAKHFFGAARNFEEGGSLTIIGTCLTDTGSRMDDLIYEEFKGTGNMELHLDRRLANKRIFPAINVSLSGTRQEELLYGEKTKTIGIMRRMLELLSDDERSEAFLDKLRRTETNDEFLKQLGKD